MRVIMGVLYWGLALYLVLLVSCGGMGQSAQPDQLEQGQAPAAAPGLPELSELDSLHAAAAVQDHVIPVTEPIAQRHTQVAGESLEFTPPADETAYALYRIDPPGPPLTLSAAGEGPMWLLVADYGTGSWVMEPFIDGHAEIDLDLVDGLYSPDGYMYSAVICPSGESGRLDNIILAYDEFDWGLTITADEDSITLSWNELDVDSYEVYRSTLSGDESPYLVGTVIEEHNGSNSFTETVPEDELGRWVPENNDNGTPEDPADDFPTIAPAVDYYYGLAVVIDGHRYASSPEVTAVVEWGDRRTTRRQLPDTTDRTLLFGEDLDLSLLTPAQIEWSANNLVGAFGLLQDEADVIRAINPDFITLGAHSSYLSAEDYQGFTVYREPAPGENEQAMYYGNETDLDGAWPYINNHEGWFIHSESSELYNQRVKVDYWIDPYDSVYWMDIETEWSDYLGTNLLQLLGEDCFDGWLLDGCHAYFAYTSDFPAEAGCADLHEYLEPRTASMLAEIGAGCDAHFLDPYVFVEARFGQTYRIGETPACMDYSGADGVCISLFGDPTYDLGPMYIFIESLGQYVLDWQNAGFATILQCNDTDWGRSDMAGFLAKYCCYLLVRGPNTYFYARNGWGDFDVYHGEPCWYPMYTWESGAPLGPQPTSLDDLKVQSDDLDGNPTDIWYYRRDFVNGSVVVVPSMAYEHPDSGIAYEYLDIYGGGVVDEDGNKSGTAQWIKMSPISTPGFLFNEASTWIIRPETEE